MLSFLKVKGIRRRWLISSVGVMVLILAVVPGTVSMKFSNAVTTAAESYTVPPPVSITLPSSRLCSYPGMW